MSHAKRLLALAVPNVITPLERPFSAAERIIKEQGLEAVSGERTSAVFDFRGAPVGWSQDLDRITALPRRSLDLTDPSAAQRWTALLRRNRSTPCDCVARFGYCIAELNNTQGWSLQEAKKSGGAVIAAGVGHGKTGISILLPIVMGVKRAVLLVPPSVKRQFLERDYPQWAAHFTVPNLSGGSQIYTDGRAVLNLVTYSELSLPKNSGLLTQLDPDLIIADEAHCLKNPRAARSRRFLRAVSERPRFFVPMSGTMTSRSIKDFAHLSQLALKDGSPTPEHPPTLDEWASALDSSEFMAPMGQLAKLCAKGETARQGFARRFAETPGVIVTDSSAVNCSLSLRVIAVNSPASLEDMIAEVRKTGQRPDGEEATEGLTVARWCRELSAGFYHRWIYPRGEPEELIHKWFSIRQAYHKEMREKLKYAREFTDSPFLLALAAARWHDGYLHDGVRYPAHTRNGPRPVWSSDHWTAWRDIRHEVKPETQAVWVDEFLVKAAVEWGRKNKGIIWVTHKDFGAKVAQELGTEYYDGGDKNPELSEKGDRSIVCTVKSTGTGKNLQRLFSTNLIANIFASGLDYEQGLGRTHRPGQLADEVTCDMFIHNAQMRKDFDKAHREALYQQETSRSPRKLCYASLDLSGAAEIDEEEDMR